MKTKFQILALFLAAIYGNTPFAADLTATATLQRETAAHIPDNVQAANRVPTVTASPPVPKRSEMAHDEKPASNLVAAPASPTLSAPDELPHSPPSNLSFYITIAVVVTAGAVNYWLSSRTMGNQSLEATKSRQADHQNKVSEYRHAWLQELRTTASDLIKAIHDGQSALMRTNLSRDYREAAQQRGDPDAAKENHEQVRLGYATEAAAASEIHKYISKIKLMFKPSDPQALKLFSLLNKVIESIGNIETRRLDSAIIEEIVAELQIILKTEWETTKTRMAKD